MASINLAKIQQYEQIQGKPGYEFQRRLHVTDNFIARLGLEAELEGHRGCVNCLDWNEKGDRLISGSDDVHVILWDPFKHKELQNHATGHYGNIFTVKFLPNSNDNMVVSGAADSKIRIHDIIQKEIVSVCSCHAGRVKRIATSPGVPNLFWSAAEDGLIMQFDIRCPHKCSSSCSNVFINLLRKVGDLAEAKCISVNPTRPELIAVGANDPYVRIYDRRMIQPSTVNFAPDFEDRSSWERFNYMRKVFMSDDSQEAALNCANYFVAGHLPLRYQDHTKKHRPLAATYITFSPDGTELLVNLGGEQIYLFNVFEPSHPKSISINSSSDDLLELPGSSSDNYMNGTNITASKNKSSAKFTDKNIKTKSVTAKNDLPESTENLKQKANKAFDNKEYTLAIAIYNEALIRSPNAPVLYCNRAAALMKRQWDGDMYSALRDCFSALTLDPNHLKAQYRLARSLYELQRFEESSQCLREFKEKFPDCAQGHACQALEKDINAMIASKCFPDGAKDLDKSETSSKSHPLTVLEKTWREQAYDYQKRFCGHCNTTTDIKEANFFGSDGQYVVAGSDDGSFFVWDKKTTNIKRILKGDDSIVNCLQPHPSYCLLASSGIDPVVRLWSPKSEDGQKNERVIEDFDSAAMDNQKRMNADPLEVMLMNMGYRINTNLEDEFDSGSAESMNERCRQS